MAFPKKIGDLCSPALLYFYLSIFSLMIAVIQNIGNNEKYTLGSFSCKVPSTMIVFTIKILYIFFWTWILNLICKGGHKGIAWLLVLFPFLLLFVILGLIMLNQA